MKNKNIVIINQATNYLTIGIINEFAKEYDNVALITGSVHVQGERLEESVFISKINKFSEKSTLRKLINWVKASTKITYLLLSKYRNSELLFFTNPPIAYLIMVFFSNKFSIMIWDVYPDILKIYGFSEKSLFYRFWKRLNVIIFKKATNIYTIGDKISELILQYTSKDKITIIPLWTSFNSFKAIPKYGNIFIKKYSLEKKFIVQYSGNIGITHNVEVLLKVAKLLEKHSTILFQIIGRGNRYYKIETEIAKMRLKNCQLLPFQDDDIFFHSLSAADIGVVVLDDKISKGSVPSKTYNLMIASKPILYIASKDSEVFNYAKTFENGKCFDSSHVEKMASFILGIESNKALHEFYSTNSLKASKNFTRENAKKLVSIHTKSKNE